MVSTFLKNFNVSVITYIVPMTYYVSDSSQQTMCLVLRIVSAYPRYSQDREAVPVVKEVGWATGLV